MALDEISQDERLITPGQVLSRGELLDAGARDLEGTAEYMIHSQGGSTAYYRIKNPPSSLDRNTSYIVENVR